MIDADFLETQCQQSCERGKIGFYLLGGLSYRQDQSGLVRRHHPPADAPNEVTHWFGLPENMKADFGRQSMSINRTDRPRRAQVKIAMGYKVR